MFVSEPICPYAEWLGLPPDGAPYSHYDLLGLSHFEQEAALIRHAARRQRRRLLTAASDPSLALVRKLLADIDRAEQCLLSPDSRRRYDRRLGGEKPLAPRWRLSLPAKTAQATTGAKGSAAETVVLVGITEPIGRQSASAALSTSQAGGK